MSRFEYYLKEVTRYEGSSGRVTRLDEDTFKKLAKDNCKDALISILSGNKIWRGDSNNDGMYYKGDASVATRKSRNTSNYYTLWMDNDSSWGNYPKRSKSFVCSNDYDYASGYGNSLKLILPYDGVKIGLCSDHDLWGSFSDIRNSAISDMDNFNGLLEKVMNILSGDANKADKTKYDVSWGILKGTIKTIDNEFSIEQIKTLLDDVANEKFNSELYKNIYGDDRVFLGWYGDYIKSFIKMLDGSLEKSLRYILSPDNNDFNIVTSKSIPRGSDREVWMEGPVLMVNDDLFKNTNIKDFAKGILE